MAGGIDFEEVGVDEYEGFEQSQTSGHRRTRRRRRHGSRKSNQVAMAHGMPPGVFLFNSSDEDAAVPTQQPERNVVVWSDLLGGLAARPAGTQDAAGDGLRTKVPVLPSQVNSATAVWPSQQQKEAQWRSTFSDGLPMDCMAALPAHALVEQVPAFEFHHLTMTVPQQPMQSSILATSPYNVSPACSGFAQQVAGPPTQTTSHQWPLADIDLMKHHQWSHADSDMMKQLLFSSAGAKIPSHAELLEQLRAVAPESYED